IKAKWYVLILGAIEFFLGIRNSAGDTVAHFAHLGGAITGLIILLIWNKSKRKSF
ncbi:MAG: rhomboid family intramembrane serine protease, partial [Chitinophagaceae bacterium]|nr:rhomboid family intramembrane serine protease [Chitinophagaceae bacterium]